MKTPERPSVWIVSLLLAAAFILVVMSALETRGTLSRWKTWLWGGEDGSWSAISIDGQPVSPGQFRISIADRAVAGGRDGCNDWGYADEGPDENGERQIVSTLVACPENDPLRGAYNVLAFDPEIELRTDGTLRLSRNGHEAIFRRCYWRVERVVTNESDSERTICDPE